MMARSLVRPLRRAAIIAKIQIRREHDAQVLAHRQALDRRTAVAGPARGRQSNDLLNGPAGHDAPAGGGDQAVAEGSAVAVRCRWRRLCRFRDRTQQRARADSRQLHPLDKWLSFIWIAH